MRLRTRQRLRPYKIRADTRDCTCIRYPLHLLLSLPRPLLPITSRIMPVLHLVVPRFLLTRSIKRPPARHHLPHCLCHFQFQSIDLETPLIPRACSSCNTMLGGSSAAARPAPSLAGTSATAIPSLSKPVASLPLCNDDGRVVQLRYPRRRVRGGTRSRWCNKHLLPSCWQP